MNPVIFSIIIIVIAIIAIIIVYLRSAAITSITSSMQTMLTTNPPLMSIPVSTIPTSVPTSFPTSVPTSFPTSVPTSVPTSFPTSIPTSFPTPPATTTTKALLYSIPTEVPTTPAPTPTILATLRDVSSFTKDDLSGYWMLHIGDMINNLPNDQDVIVLYQKFKTPNVAYESQSWPNYWAPTLQVSGKTELKLPSLKQDSTNEKTIITFPNGRNNDLVWNSAKSGYIYLNYGSLGEDMVYLKRVYLDSDGKTWKPYFVPEPTTPAPTQLPVQKQDVKTFTKDDLTGYWLLHIADNQHNLNNGQAVVILFTKTPNPISALDAQFWPNYWAPTRQMNGTIENSLPALKQMPNAYTAIRFSDGTDNAITWAGDESQYTYLNSGQYGGDMISLKRVYLEDQQWKTYYSLAPPTPVPTIQVSYEKQQIPFSITDLTGYWLLHVADNLHNMDAVFLYQKTTNPLGSLDSQFWPNYWSPVKQMTGNPVSNMSDVPSLKQNSLSSIAIHFFVNGAVDKIVGWAGDISQYNYLNSGQYGGDVVSLKRVYFEDQQWKTYQ